MGRVARERRVREQALKLIAPILIGAKEHKPGDIYVHPDWRKWLYLAAFYDTVQLAHLKAGHVLTREEFVKSGAQIMVPCEMIAELAAAGVPFMFVTERLPNLLQEKQMAARRSLGGIELVGG